MELNLDNKVFFIAGSSRGIGLGIAESFLKENAKVVITGRDKEELKKAYDFLINNYKKENILPLNCDLSNNSEIEKNLKQCVGHYGFLNGVVANIGSGKETYSTILDEAEIDNSFLINFKSSVLLAQSAIKYLNKDESSITFISSIAGLEDIKAPIMYSVNKSALLSYVKKLSTKVAPSIRVNVVAPGNIWFSGGSWDKKNNEDPKNIEIFLKNQVPMNCFGTCEDIGDMCTYLSSNKAKFITGSTVVIDGGQSKRF